MMRPRGRPPTPSAMSSPRLPVEVVSISIFSRLPSFIAEPLPNARSICASAASSAFCRSMLGDSILLPMIFNCAAMFPCLPHQCKRSFRLLAGGRAPPVGRFVSYLFDENNRGTSAFSTDHLTLFNHAVDMLEQADVAQGIALHRNEVAVRPGRHGSDLPFHAQRLRRLAG